MMEWIRNKLGDRASLFAALLIVAAGHAFLVAFVLKLVPANISLIERERFTPVEMVANKTKRTSLNSEKKRLEEAARRQAESEAALAQLFLNSGPTISPHFDRKIRRTTSTPLELISKPLEVPQKQTHPSISPNLVRLLKKIREYPKQVKQKEKLEKPIILERILPEYPEYARKKGMEGTVRLRVQILADGSCGQVQVLGSNVDTIMTDLAVKAMSRWRFTPMKVDGIPRTSFADLRMRFGLHG